MAVLALHWHSHPHTYAYLMSTHVCAVIAACLVLCIPFCATAEAVKDTTNFVPNKSVALFGATIEPECVGRCNVAVNCTALFRAGEGQHTDLDPYNDPWQAGQSGQGDHSTTMMLSGPLRTWNTLVIESPSNATFHAFELELGEIRCEQPCSAEPSTPPVTVPVLSDSFPHDRAFTEINGNTPLLSIYSINKSVEEEAGAMKTLAPRTYTTGTPLSLSCCLTLWCSTCNLLFLLIFMYVIHP